MLQHRVDRHLEGRQGCSVLLRSGQDTLQRDPSTATAATPAATILSPLPGPPWRLLFIAVRAGGSVGGGML